MSKISLAVVAAVAVMGLAVFTGLNSVSAQSTGDSIVDKIASRFSLNSDEVQVVFDEHKEERQAEKQAMFSENLQTKVDDGTITAEQKTLIEEKFAEIREAKQSLRDSDLSKDEMRSQMEQNRADLETWAEENDIPLDDIRPDHPKGHRGQFRQG